ncbi:hypothetical protein [Faecalicatena orotica]|uniref:hypothetical protein n=1 Tax=Faecalicatena orotica TaxID=1544 RepID=UPI0015E7FE32|nr:hypothetical protein [Faecalicatena orotica]
MGIFFQLEGRPPDPAAGCPQGGCAVVKQNALISSSKRIRAEPDGTSRHSPLNLVIRRLRRL